ncbi:MAG: F0F1 ATP synthase subunit delta [Bifidobacterium crudilactis]|jgi:F-type H+-transporting ATPase subunit delta|nr:F0F1 ATP synthase subunit delta [Bifidobacterium crudilactis]
MRGETSLNSDRCAREKFAPMLREANVQAGVVSSELFDFANLLDSNPRIERALTDPSRPASDKKELVDRLLEQSGALPLTKEILEDLAQRGWSKVEHIANAVEDLAVDATLYYADVKGVTATVAIELAKIHSAFLNMAQVRSRLSDTQVSADTRIKFLKQLLAGQRLNPLTLVLAEHATRDLRNRRFLATLSWLINEISRHMGEQVVTVVSAVPLTREQFSGIISAYSAKLGRPVHINSVVDPKVLGGLRIQFGAEVHDNTVVAQLQQLRRKVGVSA